ncbi:unnamed protein product [Closterium sp. NIES-54]
MTSTAATSANTAASPAALAAPDSVVSPSVIVANRPSAGSTTGHESSFSAAETTGRDGMPGDDAVCACDVARSDDVAGVRAVAMPVSESICGSSSNGADAAADVSRSKPNGSAAQLPAAAGSPVVSTGSSTVVASAMAVQHTRGARNPEGDLSLGKKAGATDFETSQNARGARKPEGDLGLRDKALAAGAAAVVSAVIMNPLDVVKDGAVLSVCSGGRHLGARARRRARPGRPAVVVSPVFADIASACCRPAKFCSRHPAFHPAVAATAASAPSPAAFCSLHRALFPSSVFPSVAFPAVAATGASAPSAAAALLARSGQMHGHGDLRRAAMSVCCDAAGLYGHGHGGVAVGSSTSNHGNGSTHGHAHGNGSIHANVTHLLPNQHQQPYQHHHPHHHLPHHHHHPYRNTWDVFTRIVREEGALRLWRGTGASLLMAVPTVGIYLPVYDILKIELAAMSINGRDRALPEAYVPLIAGSVARALACVSCAPLELARTRMQAQRPVVGAGVGAVGAVGSPVTAAGAGAGGAGGLGGGAVVGGSRPGTLATLRTILQPHSGTQRLRALWTGVDAQLARDVPFSAICWGLLEPTRRYLLSRSADWWEQKQQDRQQWVQAGSGAGAGGEVYSSVFTEAAEEARQLPLLQVVGANFAAGMAAGSVAAAATHPLDVAKTRRQIQVSGAQLNTAQTLQHLWRAVAGNYSTLVSALKKTGLSKDLKDLINCYEATFFAPNDDAFAALPENAKLATLDAKVLREVLLLHVVQKKMNAAAVKALPQDKQFKAASDGCKARLVKVTAAGADPVQLQALYGPQAASIVAPDVISLRVMQVHGVDTVILPQIMKAGDKDSLKPTVCFPWRA